MSTDLQNRPPDYGEFYWAKKTAILLGTIDAARKRSDLRRHWEDQVYFGMRNGKLSRKEAERLAFEALHRIIRGENP